MKRDKKKRQDEGTQPTQDLDGPFTAHSTEHHNAEEELSLTPEDLGRHSLESATEAMGQEDQPEGDGSIEVMVPPNQEEEEEELEPEEERERD